MMSRRTVPNLAGKHLNFHIHNYAFLMLKNKLKTRYRRRNFIRRANGNIFPHKLFSRKSLQIHAEGKKCEKLLRRQESRSCFLKLQMKCNSIPLQYLLKQSFPTDILTLLKMNSLRRSDAQLALPPCKIDARCYATRIRRDNSPLLDLRYASARFPRRARSSF